MSIYPQFLTYINPYKHFHFQAAILHIPPPSPPPYSSTFKNPFTPSHPSVDAGCRVNHLLHRSFTSPSRSHFSRKNSICKKNFILNKNS